MSLRLQGREGVTPQALPPNIRSPRHRPHTHTPTFIPTLNSPPPTRTHPLTFLPSHLHTRACMAPRAPTSTVLVWPCTTLCLLVPSQHPLHISRNHVCACAPTVFGTLLHTLSCTFGLTQFPPYYSKCVCSFVFFSICSSSSLFSFNERIVLILFLPASLLFSL